MEQLWAKVKESSTPGRRSSGLEVDYLGSRTNTKYSRLSSLLPFSKLFNHSSDCRDDTAITHQQKTVPTGLRTLFSSLRAPRNGNQSYLPSTGNQYKSISHVKTKDREDLGMSKRPIFLTVQFANYKVYDEHGAIKSIRRKSISNMLEIVGLRISLRHTRTTNDLRQVEPLSEDARIPELRPSLPGPALTNANTIWTGTYDNHQHGETQEAAFEPLTPCRLLQTESSKSMAALIKEITDNGTPHQPEAITTTRYVLDLKKIATTGEFQIQQNPGEPPDANSSRSTTPDSYLCELINTIPNQKVDLRNLYGPTEKYLDGTENRTSSTLCGIADSEPVQWIQNSHPVLKAAKLYKCRDQFLQPLNSDESLQFMPPLNSLCNVYPNPSNYSRRYVEQEALVSSADNLKRSKLSIPTAITVEIPFLGL
jgi:hypothetical protein